MLLRIIFLSLFLLLSCEKFNKNKSLKTVYNKNSFQNVEYVGNYDGDTITVNLSDSIPDIFSKNISVRIRHIDTPEMNSKNKCEKEAALKAKLIVQDILKNAKQIDLEDVGKDKFFRLLAQVNVITKDGKKVSMDKILLMSGYAVPYEGETKFKINWCNIRK